MIIINWFVLIVTCHTELVLIVQILFLILGPSHTFSQEFVPLLAAYLQVLYL